LQLVGIVRKRVEVLALDDNCVGIVLRVGVHGSGFRLDLYLLSGEPVADTFLDAYQAASGFIMNDALTWDLWAVARSHDSVGSWVPNYRDLGRTDLTAGELRHRHRAWTDRLLARRRVGGRPAT